MRCFDQKLPLIFIHVPKAAGTTVRAAFEEWYGSGFLPNYYDEEQGLMPVRHDLAPAHRDARPVVVYGHFNRLRGFGVEQCYPEASQFITILRDPFDTLVSAYFYLRQAGRTWKNQSRIPQCSLREYLEHCDTSMMLNHLPNGITIDNFKDMLNSLFIEVGVVDYLERSLRRIAGKLGRTIGSSSAKRLNVSQRDQDVPGDLRGLIAERFPVETAIFRYARSRYE